jgi:hypothetical protein
VTTVLGRTCDSSFPLGKTIAWKRLEKRPKGGLKNTPKTLQNTILNTFNIFYTTGKQTAQDRSI